ncbi:MAG: GntR family transcriptional regulator [Muribaculaceae bacterium]|nr:GntR family transcriptional regulator [Muribaculaceae bacterium]
MDFSDNKPIYRQIVDMAFNEVLAGHWPPGARIPSVRELSAELGGNSRTVLKALEELQYMGLIAPRRGMGFFLADDAPARVTAERRRLFFDTTVPCLVAEMEALQITTDELIKKIKSL